MLKVTCYRTTAYKNTDTLKVDSIYLMPAPDEITDEDRENAEKFMLVLNLHDGSVQFMPPSFLISVE